MSPTTRTVSRGVVVVVGGCVVVDVVVAGCVVVVGATVVATSLGAAGEQAVVRSASPTAALRIRLVAYIGR
jgi:hypothetical protein